MTVPATAAFVDGADIPARAQPSLACPIEKNDGDIRIALELVQGTGDGSHHIQGQAVQGSRPVQTNPAEDTFTADQNLLLGLRRGHARAWFHWSRPMMPRAMIRRMISFVPSRI